LIYKEALSIIAIVLTLTAFFPSVRSTISGDVRPHVFSWIVRSITTVLFPAAIGVACILLMAVIVYRRRVLAT
jgi:hypothetical protein